jgi:eukaryotic-like serine/threonine-protein kinase
MSRRWIILSQLAIAKSAAEKIFLTLNASNSMTRRPNRTPRTRCAKLGVNGSAVLVLILILANINVSVAGFFRESAPPKFSLAQALTVRWRYASSATLNLTPAADTERIYLPLAAGTIVSLGASDGQLYWKSDVGGEFSASPAADAKALYVASEATGAGGENHPGKGSLRALGREAGVTIWLQTLPLPLRGGLAMSTDRIFAGASDGGFYSFDKATGNIVWTVQIGTALNCTPVLSKQGLYVGAEDGTLFSLEAGTGKVRWLYHTGGPVRGPVAVNDDTVYFGSGDGYVYAVSEADGHLRWRTRTGAGVQAVTAVHRGLLVASFDNFVYLLSFARGKSLWKRQLPGRISAQPVTAEDGALFTPLASDAGVVLTLRDGKQVNSLPTGDGANTAAAPIIVGETVFLTTDQGLVAFSPPAKKIANQP